MKVEQHSYTMSCLSVSKRDNSLTQAHGLQYSCYIRYTVYLLSHIGTKV